MSEFKIGDEVYVRSWLRDIATVCENHAPDGNQEFCEVAAEDDHTPGSNSVVPKRYVQPEPYEIPEWGAETERVCPACKTKQQFATGTWCQSCNALLSIGEETAYNFPIRDYEPGDKVWVWALSGQEGKIISEEIEGCHLVQMPEGNEPEQQWYTVGSILHRDECCFGFRTPDEYRTTRDLEADEALLRAAMGSPEGRTNLGDALLTSLQCLMDDLTDIKLAEWDAEDEDLAWQSEQHLERLHIKDCQSLASFNHLMTRMAIWLTDRCARHEGRVVGRDVGRGYFYPSLGETNKSRGRRIPIDDLYESS